MQPVDFNSLVPELSGWNGGEGIDIDNWIGCVGNYEHAIGYSRLFWPEFIAHDGCVFLKSHMTLENYAGFTKQSGGDKSSVESVINHEHIEDMFGILELEPRHEQMIYLGRAMREMWSCKLRRDFPHKRFEVNFDDQGTDDGERDYVITFYQVREDSRPDTSGEPNAPPGEAEERRTSERRGERPDEESERRDAADPDGSGDEMKPVGELGERSRVRLGSLMPGEREARDQGEREGERRPAELEPIQHPADEQERSDDAESERHDEEREPEPRLLRKRWSELRVSPAKKRFRPHENDSAQRRRTQGRSGIHSALGRFRPSAIVSRART